MRPLRLAFVLAACLVTGASAVRAQASQPGVAGGPSARDSVGAAVDTGPRGAARTLTVFDYVTELPLAGVEIGIRRKDAPQAFANLAWTTAADGTITIPALPVGPYALEMRKLGYRPGLVFVNVATGDSAPVHVKLEDVSTRLATVVTTGQRVPAKLLEFYTRMSTSPQARTSFITPDEIKQRNPRVASDLLRDRGNRAWNCKDGALFVDGVYMRDFGVGQPRARSAAEVGQMTARQRANMETGSLATAFMDNIPVDHITAMEVYVGSSQIPAQFNVSHMFRNLPAGCAIVLWTK